MNELRQLAEVASVFNGKTPARSEQREVGFPVLKIRDVNELGLFRGRFESFIDPKLASRFIGKQIQKNDTLVLNAAHNAEYVGSKTFLVCDNTAGALATGEWLLVRPNSKILDPKFAHFWITSPNTKRQFKDLVKGIHLYPKDVARLKIPLPPLDEQKRIAAILDKADQLYQKRRQAIALLDSLTQSIFLEMFEETAAQAWPMATIGEVAIDMRTGPFGSQLLHSEFVDDGIAVLGIDNAVSNRFEWGKARFITEEKYRQLSRYTVRPDDVLITIMGTCGRCAVVPDNIPTAINTKHLCCITLDRGRVLPQYLHSCFLNNPGVLRQLGVQAKGAVMPGLNMGIIKSLSIPVPPITLQQAFKVRLSALSHQVAAAEMAAERSDTLFSSLQHRAFSGQL